MVLLGERRMYTKVDKLLLHTLHNIECALYSVQLTVFTEHFLLCTVQCTVYSVHYTLKTIVLCTLLATVHRHIRLPYKG